MVHVYSLLPIGCVALDLDWGGIVFGGFSIHKRFPDVISYFAVHPVGQETDSEMSVGFGGWRLGTWQLATMPSV